MGGRNYSTISQAPHPFVFRPGGTQRGNVFTSWADLMDAIAAVPDADKVLYIDDTVAEAIVPVAGSPHDMSRVAIFGRTPDVGGYTWLRIADGAQMVQVHELGHNLGLRHNAVASGVPGLVYSSGGTEVLQIDRSILRSEATSVTEMIRVSGGTTLEVSSCEGIVESLAPSTNPVIRTLAGTTVEMKLLNRARVDRGAMAGAAGSTHRYSMDDDSHKSTQPLMLGTQNFLAGGLPTDAGTVQITVAPGLIVVGSDFGRTYNELQDALDLAAMIPSDVKVKIAFDDSYSPGPLTFAADTYVIPQNSILSNGAETLALRDADRQVVQFTDGATLAISASTKRYTLQNLILRHVQTSPLISESVDTVFALVSSKVRIAAAATVALAEVTGGQDLTLLAANGGAEREVAITLAPGWNLVGGGGTLSVNAQGRSAFARRAISATGGPIAAASVVRLDPQSSIELQDALAAPASFVLSGAQAVENNVATEPTVISKLQLAPGGASGDTAIIKQGTLLWFDDAGAVVPTIGGNFILESALGAPETYVAAAAPAPFAFVAAPQPTAYENIVDAINTSSTLYDAELVYNTEKWTGATFTPDVAILITPKTQPTEQINHRIYSTVSLAPATPSVADFHTAQNTYDTTAKSPLPLTDPGEQFGFGYGSFVAQAEGFQVKAISPANKLYAVHNGTTNAEEAWRPVVGTDVENRYTTVGTKTLSRGIQRVILNGATIGAGTITAQTPPGKNYGKGDSIVFHREADGNPGGTCEAAVPAGDTINLVAATPIPLTPGQTLVLYNRGPAVPHLPGSDWIAFGPV
jgi:phage baseplate assembly protein gpV